MKKLLSMALAIVLTVSLMAAVVYAAPDPDPKVIKPVVELK
jgi:hypothetical protein